MIVPQIVNKSFTGTGNSEYVRSDGDLLLDIDGTFSATIKLGIADPPAPGTQPSFKTLTKDSNGDDIQFTGPFSGLIHAGPSGMLWRLECPTYVSGPVVCKLVGG